MLVQWGILIVLVLILIVLLYYSIFSPSEKSPVVIEKESKSLEEIAAIMKEARERRDREEKEQELIEYAKSKRKNSPPPIRISSDYSSDRPVKTDAKILVPFKLDDLDKRILEEFYSNRD
jgi:septal ring-binding cell division protein DamX